MKDTYKCLTIDELKKATEFYIQENFPKESKEEYLQHLAKTRKGKYFKYVGDKSDIIGTSLYHVKDTDYSNDDNITTVEIIEQNWADKEYIYQGIAHLKLNWNELIPIPKKEFDDAYNQFNWEENFDMDYEDDVEDCKRRKQMHEEASHWPVQILKVDYGGNIERDDEMPPEKYFGFYDYKDYGFQA